MKVTSLKELEGYIYSNVVLPLKDLQVEPLRIESPMFTDDGLTHYELFLTTEELGERLNHNYQRDEARNHALILVMLRKGNARYIVADYDRFTKRVQLYPNTIQATNRGNLLCNKLKEAFEYNTPFGKVTVMDGIRDKFIPHERLHGPF